MPRSPSKLPTGDYDVAAVAKAAGVSSHLLRIWEIRYLWPMPRRRPNGYRAYNQAQLDEIVAVCAFLKKHKVPITTLVNAHGEVEWPGKRVPPKLRPDGFPNARPYLQSIPGPCAAFGKEVVDALDRESAFALRLVLARAAATVRPLDRTALWMGTIAALTELALWGKPFPDAQTMVQYIKTSDPSHYATISRTATAILTGELQHA